VHHPSPGWDVVRGEIKAPKNAAYIYWVRLQALDFLSWAGAFKFNALEVRSMWVPAAAPDAADAAAQTLPA
jgi:hypothetical protein